MVVVGRLSWRQRLPGMKFPAELELSRKYTGREIPAALSFTTEVRGSILTIEGLMTLTTGHGGRIGHAAITCPPAPQYKHRLWLILLCHSQGESRVPSTSIGSWPGFGGLMVSGRQRSGVLGVSSAMQDCIRVAQRMESCINRSKP